MPIFEYQCSDCKSKFEIFHKSGSNLDDVSCPKCGSKEYKKLLSAFSASIKASGHSHQHEACASGGCGMADYGGCAGGMCGLN
jgi:putative FmdB family regulatory protein